MLNRAESRFNLAAISILRVLNRAEMLQAWHSAEDIAPPVKLPDMGHMGMHKDDVPMLVSSPSQVCLAASPLVPHNTLYISM